MTRRKWLAASFIVASGWILPSLAVAAETGAAATLSVLAAPVERHPGGGPGVEPGVNGMNLAEGDRIKTGPSGAALITFLNGTTVAVLSGSEITVKQVDDGRQSSGMRVFIHAGRVWARVVGALGRRTPLSLESNEYAATAHDGLIGAEQGADGFVCWTRRGDLRLTGRGGREITVTAGHRARPDRVSPIVQEPFQPSASVIEVRTSGPVVPLVRMPGGRLAAGFVSSDIEVNQVFGSLTAHAGGDRWLIEVPGGLPGPYTLVLTATGTGSFTAQVSGRHGATEVYRRELSGDVRPGDRLATRFTQQVRGQEARSAQVLGAEFEDLRPWDGQGAGRGEGMARVN